MRPTNFVRPLYLLGIVATVLAVDGRAFACSGPGAMEAILRAERLGWILWGVTLLVAVGSTLVPRLRAAGFRKQWPLLLLLVLHPGWWMSARSGDCGRTLLAGSVLVAALTPLVAGVLFWRSGRAARAA
ncbi:hypothetical protein [Polyangium jinanense]|uniref:Uncharacterized protein n=1 Tax=Polyangium jinanense TaxID=2829994 RepID=A0A9X3X3K0_9BACT|nr:hypothetical protein [Polyangium jinanense]MDC3955257.1 hypothetical protein [Polyangium jinanense]MDC3981558.1 hypothetical protein [Polyangium jinanense]